MSPAVNILAYNTLETSDRNDYLRQKANTRSANLGLRREFADFMVKAFDAEKSEDLYSHSRGEGTTALKARVVDQTQGIGGIGFLEDESLEAVSLSAFLPAFGDVDPTGFEHLIERGGACSSGNGGAPGDRSASSDASHRRVHGGVDLEALTSTQFEPSAARADLERVIQEREQRLAALRLPMGHDRRIEAEWRSGHALGSGQRKHGRSSSRGASVRDHDTSTRDIDGSIPSPAPTSPISPHCRTLFDQRSPPGDLPTPARSSTSAALSRTETEDAVPVALEGVLEILVEGTTWEDLVKQTAALRRAVPPSELERSESAGGTQPHYRRERQPRARQPRSASEERKPASAERKPRWQIRTLPEAAKPERIDFTFPKHNVRQAALHYAQHMQSQHAHSSASQFSKQHGGRCAALTRSKGTQTAGGVGLLDITSDSSGSTSKVGKGRSKGQANTKVEPASREERVRSTPPPSRLHLTPASQHRTSAERREASQTKNKVGSEFCDGPPGRSESSRVAPSAAAPVRTASAERRSPQASRGQAGRLESNRAALSASSSARTASAERRTPPQKQGPVGQSESGLASSSAPPSAREASAERRSPLSTQSPPSLAYARASAGKGNTPLKQGAQRIRDPGAVAAHAQGPRSSKIPQPPVTWTKKPNQTCGPGVEVTWTANSLKTCGPSPDDLAEVHVFPPVSEQLIPAEAMLARVAQHQTACRMRCMIAVFRPWAIRARLQKCGQLVQDRVTSKWNEQTLHLLLEVWLGAVWEAAQLRHERTKKYGQMVHSLHCHVLKFIFLPWRDLVVQLRQDKEAVRADASPEQNSAMGLLSQQPGA